MSDKDRKDPETTGHEWDGIEEFNNPLPRWWVWVFYICVVWAIWYVIAYPAWPLANKATPGYLGFSTRGEVAAEIQKFADANAELETQMASADLTVIADNADLHNYAKQSGGAVFRTWCAQCHGSGANGAVGYPNLRDNDWLWGGDIEAIAETIRVGIRDPLSDDARYSEMPAFGDDYLSDEEISQVVNYVLKISGGTADDALAGPGETVFMDNCAACHMEDGTGDREQGAPNLIDAIWLFGGDEASITEQVKNGPYGVMPAWVERLGESQVRAVAAYVHQLGGGE